jgi:putative FmdB family regulatory protein
VPLYEYQCETCGRFEVMRKFSDPPLSVCPTCRGSVDKLLSAPAIQFKGSGWYVTDYPRQTAKAEAKTDGPAEKKSGESTTAGDSATKSTPSKSESAAGDGSKQRS